MFIVCPICQTLCPKMTSNFCKTCGWDLSLIEIDERLKQEKYSPEIDWSKKVWESKKAMELRAITAENAISDKDDQIELLQRRLERLTQEKNKEKEIALENIIKEKQEFIETLESKTEQLEKTILTTKATNQQQISLLNNKLNNRQMQMEQLQTQLRQMMIERDDAIELAQELEKDYVQPLETEISKLKHRLQVIENYNEELETNLQKQRTQLLQVTTERDDFDNQVEDIKPLKQMAQKALSQWLESKLLDSFIAEVKNITNSEEALSDIKRLQQKRLHQEWQNRPIHRHILGLVVELLEQDNKNTEKFKQQLEDYNVISI